MAESDCVHLTSWSKVRQVFGDALELPSLQRQAFIELHCGADQLAKAAVGALLQAHDEAALALEPSEWTRSPQRSETTMPGKRIGQYTIQRLIAEGGMGAVYEAEQDHPHRTVALKIFRHGVASPSALRRFEFESQILARLQHPGIAHVHDAGMHDDGTGGVPYFVMEYIPDARSVTDFARDHALTTRQRLELFMQTCDAVHHGHQKGIIHRDIKPANILVSSGGVIKVIDFGVARATDADIAVTTLHTTVGQLVGTLQYMSPEQVEADPHDIDIRSDVYSLGLVLYEMLSGQPPYDVSTARMLEAARLIREQVPTRLSMVDRSLRGDLETIVVKALEKDRERRYQSAADLRSDIQRFLANQPIAARPPNHMYHVRTFVRRNRALAASMATIFATLLLGIATTTWQAVRARSAASRAQQVNEFLKGILSAPNPNPWYVAKSQFRPTRSGPDVKIVELLDDAVRALDCDTSMRPEVEADIRLAIGSSLGGLDRYGDAEAQIARALQIREEQFGPYDPRTLECLSPLAWSVEWQGRLREAEEHLRRALHGFMRLRGDNATLTINAKADLAIFLADGATKEAEDLAREVLRQLEKSRGTNDVQTLFMQSALARLLTNAGRSDEGYRLAAPSLEAMRSIVSEDDLHLCFAELCLGQCAMGIGNPVEGEEHLRVALEIATRAQGRGRLMWAITMGSLADAMALQKRWDEFELMANESMTARRKLFGDGHPYTQSAVKQLADGYVAQGKTDLGRALLQSQSQLPISDAASK